MKEKIIKRIILVVMVILLALVSLGYGLGLFNGFMNRYVAARVDQDVSSITPTETIPDSSSGATEDVSNQTDGTTSATMDTGDDATFPKTTPAEATPIPSASSQPSGPSGAESIVSIVQSPKAQAVEITQDEILQMVRNAVDLAGGLGDIIENGQVVVIKPNLVQMHVDSTGELFDKEVNGATTDWRVTRAVVQLVRELNPSGKIYVMEGSAGDKTRPTMAYLNYTSAFMPEVDEFIYIEEDSGGWQAFDSTGLVKVYLQDGLLHKEYYLNKKYYEADVVISVPCLKTSSGVSVTGGIKNVAIGATPANIYGRSPDNPSRTKMVSHKMIDGALDKWIYDYYRCKPADFVVIDGLQGFQNGPVPIGSKNVLTDRMNMRLIMAGKDAVAVDTIEALVMGWDPLAITYLGYLNKSGLGNIDIREIAVSGKKVSEVRQFFLNKLPKLGGVPITDTSGPILKNKSQTVNSDELKLSLELEAGTLKLEIFIDGQLIMTHNDLVTGDFIIDISSLAPGTHDVALLAYDRFLNMTEINERFKK